MSVDTNASTDANIEDVVNVVRTHDDDSPVAMEIEDKLTEVTTADPQQAHELLSDALDLGVLEEDDTRQGFGGIRLGDADVDADADVSNSDEDESTGENAGSVDANPGGGTDKDVSGKAALDDAISWFHAQIDKEIYDHTDEANEDVDGAEDHSDRPNTAREWFLENRGFKPETIEDKRLGWAPPHCTDELLAYLHRQGHSREEILASGVFTFPGDDEDGEKQNPDGNPSVSFSGRYIFPYFDETGTAAYAISRCTGSVGGRDYDGHPSDFHSGKYSKLSHTKNYVTVEEPIYGVQSLENDGPVIITEGVCDAIRAHEHGYACLSPVTTQFKKEHREQLADILRDTGRRTYIVQDAERPVVEYTDEGDGWECLGIEQFGEGLKGAARTSAFLAREGIDAYLAELPRIGVDKIDLDDYLGTWSDTLAPVLAGAKPGQEHPAYEPTTVGHLNNADVDAYADANANANANTHVDVDTNGSGESSHTYAGDYDTLTKAEITDALEHVSSTLSYDEWIQMGYAVHSWDPGQEGKQVFTQWSRQSPKWESPTSPNAIDWIWNNANPQRAAGHTTVGTLIAYAKQGGWEPPSRSLEPTAAVPLEMLASLDLDDARRFASKHDIEWATTREARERLRDEVFEVMQHGDTKVIDAPTALGKSYTVATEPWIRRESTTGGAPVIHTHETTKARDQAAQESADAGFEYAVLEGRTEACPVAAGEHDPLGREGTVDDFDREELPETVITIDGTPASDFFDTACEDRGLPFSVAHKYLENHTDQDVDLPCCAGEGECPAVTQWDGLPRTESGEPAVDVIHCTHKFAHVPSLRNGTNLIFDERPDFREDLSHRQVREAISAYLSAADAPVTTFEEFVTGALDGDHTGRIKQSMDYEPDREWYLETEGAHTLAPALTRAVYYALKPEQEGFAQDANGRYSATVPHEPPRLDADASDESGWNRTYVSVTLDANNTVRTVRNSPSLNGARSVIGLDAHPAQTQWELNVHPDIETSAVLDPAERAMWRRFERGLLTVGVGDATRPFTSGEYFDRDGSEAFFAALRERFGEDFRTAITAASVEEETKDILREVGVEDPDTMHYGEEKSRNDFAGEDIGALNGCIDPGDDFVLDLLAERGLDATPERSDSDCEYCDGEGCHECNGTGKERAHGRGFVGPDADAANELLASVREQHIAQGAGRLARNADDPEDRAIVFVRTDAAPPGFLDMQVPGVEWLATDTQTEIIETLSQRSSATTREIADEVGCSKEHARDTLRRLYDRDIVDVHENAGDHGAHLYRVLAGMDGPANTRPSEHVDLSPSVDEDGDADETANEAVWEYNTWSLVVSSVTPSGSVMSTGSTPGSAADPSQSSDAAAVDTGEPPG